MNLTCLIIDDEPLARKRLEVLIKAIPQLELIGQCGTGKEAILLIEKKSPGLIFLDIQMKDMSGFDVLKKIDVSFRPKIIFVTAFDKYAVKAFEHFAFDYLLKPFKKERFLQSVERVIKISEVSNDSGLERKLDGLLSHMINSAQSVLDNHLDKLPIRTGGSITFIGIDTIKYVLASGSYVDIVTKSKSYVQRTSMTEILDLIGNKHFLRVHRSTIIGLYFLDKIKYTRTGDMDIKMQDGSLFRVSKSYRQTVQKKLGI